GLWADRPGHQERRREVDPGPRACVTGPGRARADEAPEAGGDPGRHFHGDQPGGLRIAVRHSDHSAAPGRDSGVGTIEKRPVVVNDENGQDALGIRTVGYLALSFDHRLIDGADADRFMASVKKTLETGEFDLGYLLALSDQTVPCALRVPA